MIFQKNQSVYIHFILLSYVCLAYYNIYDYWLILWGFFSIIGVGLSSWLNGMYFFKKIRIFNVNDKYCVLA